MRTCIFRNARVLLLSLLLALLPTMLCAANTVRPAEIPLIRLQVFAIVAMAILGHQNP
jgi:hypothetical protein